MALMSALTDAFPGTALNPALWSPFGTVSVSGGVVTLTDVANTASFSGFSSKNQYDLTGSYLAAMLVTTGTPEPNTAAILRAQNPSGTNQLSLLYSNGQLVAQTWVNGVLSTVSTAAYNASSMTWLRIREAAGTTYFEYTASYAATTWALLGSVTDPFPVTSLIALIEHGSGLTTDPQTASQWAAVNPAATGSEMYFGAALDTGTASSGPTGGFTYEVATGGGMGVAYNTNMNTAAAPAWGDPGQSLGLMMLITDQGGPAPITGAATLAGHGSISAAGTVLGPVAAGAEMYFGAALDNSAAVAGTTSGFTYEVATGGGMGVAYDTNVTSTAAPVWGDSKQALGLAVLLADQSGAGITVVQAVSFAGGTSGSFAAPVTVGNSIVLAICDYNTSGATITSTSPQYNGGPVAGSQQAYQFQNAGTIAMGTSLWLLPGVQSSGVTVSFTQSGGFNDGNSGFALFEISGLGPSPSFDAASPDPATASSPSGGSNNPASGTTGAITAAPEIIFGTIMESSGSLTDPAAPWTNQSPNGFTAMGYQIVAASGGRYSYAGTDASAPKWAAGVVAIKAGGASGPVAGAATLTGKGSVTGGGTIPAQLTATLAGAGKITGTGTLATQPGAATLAGAGSLRSAVTTRPKALTLTALGSLAATPVTQVKVDITVFVGATASRSQVRVIGPTQGDGKIIPATVSHSQVGAALPTQGDGKVIGPTTLNRSR